MLAEADVRSVRAADAYRSRDVHLKSVASGCRFVERAVATALGVEPESLRRPGRGSAEQARARQTAMYLTHVVLGLSLSQVGGQFGRDRTTVSHACSRIEDQREDPKFERMIGCLEAALHHWQLCSERSE